MYFNISYFLKQIKCPMPQLCHSKRHEFSKGYNIPDDAPLVKTLMGVYRKRTGDKTSKPVKMGGGTYARHLPNAVSFGPEGYMCGSECHVANEYIGIDQLIFNAQIIADAIIALACEK